jgi:adenylate kinase
MDLSYRQNLALEGEKHEHAKELQKIAHENQMELQKIAHENQMEEDTHKALVSGNGNQPSDPYSIVLSNATKAK